MVASDGERWIAAQNITRFENMLKLETDEAKRRVLLDLIEKERQKMRSPKPG